MSNAKHTPGPWHPHDMETNVLCGTDHKSICDCAASSRSENENRANAKLIAAAPDMAEALKFLISEWSEHETLISGKSVIENARAALAKAGVE